MQKLPKIQRLPLFLISWRQFAVNFWEIGYTLTPMYPYLVLKRKVGVHDIRGRKRPGMSWDTHTHTHNKKQKAELKSVQKRSGAIVPHRLFLKLLCLSQRCGASCQGSFWFCTPFCGYPFFCLGILRFQISNYIIAPGKGKHRKRDVGMGKETK